MKLFFGFGFGFGFVESKLLWPFYEDNPLPSH